MPALVKELKPHILAWNPADQENCIVKCINAWSEQNWGTKELIICEKAL